MMAKERNPIDIITGFNVRRLRKKMDVTQESLAAAYPCEKNFISQLETGRKPAGKDVRQTLGRIFQCAEEEFIRPVPAQECGADYDAGPPPLLDTALLSQVVQVIEEYLADHHLKISPQRKGLLVAKLMEHCHLDREKPTPLLVRSYLRLV